MQEQHEDTFGPDAIRDQGKVVRDVVGQYEDAAAEWTRLYWLKVSGLIKSGVGRSEARDIAEGEMIEENEQLWTTMREQRKELVQRRALLDHATAASAIESGAFAFSTPGSSTTEGM